MFPYIVYLRTSTSLFRRHELYMFIVALTRTTEENGIILSKKIDVKSRRFNKSITLEIEAVNTKSIPGPY